MGDIELAEIAKETIHITKAGHYNLNGKNISLKKNPDGRFDDVVVLSPSKLKSIMNDEDKFFEKTFYGHSDCEFYLLACDSYEVAKEMERPLVMNFANAIYPGGGFLSGARAQEESLCRNSTLYASLTSKNAYEMYEYNANHLNPIDSDYMLLSQCVSVFRDEDHELLENPYMVSVMTIPAPNKKRRAAKVKQGELDRVMKDRLRYFLMAAARYGYSELVLGAWGCGAFGHDTKKVAQYFYELFFEEKFKDFFKMVTFAILGDDDKCDAFMEIFGDKLEDCRWNEETDKKNIASGLYLQTKYPMPICNHTSDIRKENVGYTQGIISDGTPFQAEIWEYEHTKVLSIIISDREEFYLLEDTIKSTDAISIGNITGFHNEATYRDEAVLIIGMAIRDMEGEDIDVIKLVGYLEEKDIVDFPGTMINGAASTFTDIEGHDVIRVNITLEEDGEVYAKTDLQFMDFPNRPRNTKFEVVK